MPKDKGQNKGEEAPNARARNHAAQKAEHSEMGPSELLSEHMDSVGNPVPEPTWGPTKNQPNEESDLFDAMNAETSEFIGE